MEFFFFFFPIIKAFQLTMFDCIAFTYLHPLGLRNPSSSSIPCLGLLEATRSLSSHPVPISTEKQGSWECQFLNAKQHSPNIFTTGLGSQKRQKLEDSRRHFSDYKNQEKIKYLCLPTSRPRAILEAPAPCCRRKLGPRDLFYRSS